ncbi:MAG: biopolymer transporter ExbD [Gammaproteobacteria bacterium]
MRSKWRKRRQAETPEMNITAFMNLMVVLVPFLLITAVFSRLAIIELNLPAASSVAAEEPTFQLEVTVREDGLEVGERSQGLLTRLPRIDGQHDLDGLAHYLQRVKANYPEMSNATVLLEPDVSYDTLVQVMDVLRSYQVGEGRQVVHAELFPDISIGDAPALGAAASKGS